MCALRVIIYRSYLRLLIKIDNSLVLFTLQALCSLPIAVCIMSLYEEVKVHGYDEFCKAVSDRKGKDIFAYFSGDKDADGNSWCPDCVKGNVMNRKAPSRSVIYQSISYWKTYVVCVFPLLAIVVKYVLLCIGFYTMYCIIS